MESTTEDELGCDQDWDFESTSSLSPPPPSEAEELMNMLTTSSSPSHSQSQDLIVPLNKNSDDDLFSMINSSLVMTTDARDHELQKNLDKADASIGSITVEVLGGSEDITTDSILSNSHNDHIERREGECQTSIVTVEVLVDTGTENIHDFPGFRAKIAKEVEAMFVGVGPLRRKIFSFSLGEELCQPNQTIFPKPWTKSVKAVQYENEKINDVGCFLSDEPFTTRVCVYRMRYDAPKTHEGRLTALGETLPLPNITLEGLWERLMFVEDWRDTIMRIVSNMVGFSNIRKKEHNSRLNKLILLHGPPGTGKTTLGKGLAQKVAIRLSDTYSTTQLAHIDGTKVFKRYFGESAQTVREIFDAILSCCLQQKENLLVVLIDEVEVLAVSRVQSAARQEPHDSVKVCDALLTGIERLEAVPNVVLICTTNMQSTLDEAFLSRCDFSFEFHRPPPNIRYEIIRDGVHELIQHGVIQSQEKFPIPTFGEAQTQLRTPMLPGSIVTRICMALEDYDARKLGKFAESTLTRYLGTTECSLKKTLRLMEMAADTVKEERRAKRAAAEMDAEPNKVSSAVRFRTVTPGTT